MARGVADMASHVPTFTIYRAITIHRTIHDSSFAARVATHATFDVVIDDEIQFLIREFAIRRQHEVGFRHTEMQ